MFGRGKAGKGLGSGHNDGHFFIHLFEENYLIRILRPEWYGIYV